MSRPHLSQPLDATGQPEPVLDGSSTALDGAAPRPAPGQIQIPGHPPGQQPAQSAAGISQPMQLRDIHMPPSAPFWPLAPGWWLLAALALAALAALGWRLWRLLRLRRRRERIITELDQLRRLGRGPELAAAVSAILKRAALNRYPRREVAALSGVGWVEFLDRTGGGGRFTDGPGRVLADGVYAPRHDCDVDALLALAGQWLRKNL